MKNKFPLVLSSFYLDFSFPGHFSNETRLFINIPYCGEYIQNNKEINFLTICYEMNSSFNKNDCIINEMNSGLKIMISTSTIDLKCIKNIKKSNIINALELNNATSNNLLLFDSEKEFYSLIINSVNQFIDSSYGQPWLNFTKQKYLNYIKKTPTIYLTNKTKEIDLNYETEKITKFIKEVKFNFTKILDISTLNILDNEKEFKKLNISFNNNKIMSQIIPNQLLGENSITELIKIIKTLNYYKLSEDIKPTNNSLIKYKKKI